MANFMGPMAPPQAAPSQPPQLDVRTNPSQRAQFKSFMQGMRVPPTTAPVAPMLPAPSPMDDIDIFAPAPMADGGVVGGLQSLGEMSDQMVDALNTVVYGGSQGGGMPSSGGIGGPMSSGGGFGGGQMPAPLPPITTLPSGATPPALLPPAPPPIGAAPKLPDRLSLNDMSLLGMPTPAYMPMDPDGDGVDQFNRPMESSLTDEQRAQAEQDQQERLKNLRSRFSEGGVFGSGSMGSPLSRLGMMGGLGSIFGYEDGGPVGMQRGGVTFKSGERFETGRGIAEQQRERAAAAAARGEDPGEEAGIDRGFPNEVMRELERSKVKSIIPAEDALATIKAMDAAAANFTGGSEPTSTNVRTVPAGTDTDQFFVNQNMARDQALDDAVKSIIAVDKTEQFDDALGEALGVTPVTAPPVDMPGADPMNDLLFGEGRIDVPIIDPRAGRDSVTPMEQFYLDQEARRSVEDSGVGGPIGSDNVIFSGVEDTSVEGPLAEAGSSFDRLMVGDVVYNRGKENERTLDRLADLENRMSKGNLNNLFGGATKLYENVVEQGKTPIVAADTNQIVGYADDGPFGKVYTGQPDYNPFGAEGQPYTVDQATGALIVQRKSYMDNVGRPTSDDPVLTTPAVPTSPTQPPATPNPPMITPPDNPFLPAPPQDVVVPSPRGPVNIGAPVLSAPNIAPVQPVGLPQSFLDLLANFNRPAPVAMQDGGAVLDKAADNFLEALKVA